MSSWVCSQVLVTTAFHHSLHLSGRREEAVPIAPIPLDTSVCLSIQLPTPRRGFGAHLAASDLKPRLGQPGGGGSSPHWEVLKLRRLGTALPSLLGMMQPRLGRR